MAKPANKTALISPDGLLTYFSHIFANSKDMINLFSLTHRRILLWNEAATASMGYTMEDFEKVPLEKHYPPAELIKLGKVFEALATTGYAFEKLKMYTKSGELKDLWIRSFVIQQDPEVICLSHTIDVTEEKNRENKAIREAKLASLGEASAVLSHELSNALQLIEYNINIIEAIELNLSKEAVVKMEKIKSAITRMSEIINSVMKYARQSTVQTTVHTSLGLTIEDAMNILRGYLENKKITLEMNIPADLPLVKADSGHVQQILLILVKNAAQALIDQPVRKISIAAKKGKKKIELTITDTGPGIPDEIQRYIFDAFTTTKPVGIGLGLGLSIAKRLAFANSIEIHFRSSHNAGTVFTLEFEQEGVAAAVESQLKKEGNFGRSVALVVDDNANNLTETVSCLQKLKIRALIASSAREGLKLLSMQKFDFVFCGENMYPVTGTMFAKEARHSFKGPICLIGTSDKINDELSADHPEKLFYIKRPFLQKDIDDTLKHMVSDDAEGGLR
jgi:PAS domain S-box-containing protein